QALANARIGLNDVSALVVNPITGLAIPSLDAKLMNRLKFPQAVERIPIFGLGCGGGVAGLARSARYAQAMPQNSHVLFLTIDLCSLCLRIADPSMAMFVSAALFGDGAAGVVLGPVDRKEERGGAGGASSRAAIISGPTPNASWVGISRRTASAWCSAPSCRRSSGNILLRQCGAFSTRTAWASASSPVSCCIPAAPRFSRRRREYWASPAAISPF